MAIVTVGDLIAELQKFPANKPLKVDDPDTGWLAPVVEVSDEDGHVELRLGDYGDMEIR